jgi:hypothetical protein
MSVIIYHNLSTLILFLHAYMNLVDFPNKILKEKAWLYPY